MSVIGKIVATERAPSTVDDFYFWTDKNLLLRPFDVVKVSHINDSATFGVVEEISHITDTGSSLAGFISSDFGDATYLANTDRIGMNYVKARVVGNTNDIYTPVQDGRSVSLANAGEILAALGLSEVKNPLPAGYLEMYQSPNRVTVPVHFNSHFLIGPEGAHLNISGISGLAAKTSYAMFLLKAVQDEYRLNAVSHQDSVAFVFLNVKGRDLLAVDQSNPELNDDDKSIYEMLGSSPSPFQQVTYFFPFSKDNQATYASTADVKSLKERKKAFHYKYTYEDDKDKIDLLFANVDDPNQTMDSIVQFVANGQGGFGSVTTWDDFMERVRDYTKAGSTRQQQSGQEISVLSWRKFARLFAKIRSKSPFFVNSLGNDVRLEDCIGQIKKNDVFVVDVARLDDETQGFVFGDVIQSIYDLKLGQTEREEDDIPAKVIVFIDELNKYASKDVPKNSPILRKLLEITERGRSLGIILFSAEQFKSDIHDRVKGNCATHAYGRTNAIEVSKSDYQFVPPVYKTMLTRLKQGEYILQNPIFRSLLNIKFPNPVYKQHKHG